MNDDLWCGLRASLDKLERQGLRRHLRPLVPNNRAVVTLPDGKQVVNFSSNDYLGLKYHPALVNAALEAVNLYGTGAGASRLIAGDTPLHNELEATLADFKGAEAALVFSSGYLASLGLLQVLCNVGDGVPVYFDKLSHACIVDAARREAWRSFPHNNVTRLEELLASTRPAPRARYRAVVVTEGVFSMDGDLAPLPDLLQLCVKYDAVLVVDDAHGTGTIGPMGRGAAAHWGVTGHEHLIHLGTLSKSLGSQGGFVAGPRVLIDLLITKARTFIFDTGLAPAAAAAALEALRLIKDEPKHVSRLTENIALFQQELAYALPDLKSSTPIFPIIVGSAEAAMSLGERLLAEGFLTIPIRPPTVPPNSSRLRITLSSVHNSDDIVRLASALRAAISK